MRFNLKSGLASQRKLSESAVDFPRVNECYTGRYFDSLIFLVLLKEYRLKSMGLYGDHTILEQETLKLKDISFVCNFPTKDQDPHLEDIFRNTINHRGI